MYLKYMGACETGPHMQECAECIFITFSDGILDLSRVENNKIILISNLIIGFREIKC